MISIEYNAEPLSETLTSEIKDMWRWHGKHMTKLGPTPGGRFTGYVQSYEENFQTKITKIVTNRLKMYRVLENYYGFL